MKIYQYDSVQNCKLAIIPAILPTVPVQFQFASLVEGFVLGHFQHVKTVSIVHKIICL